MCVGFFLKLLRSPIEASDGNEQEPGKMRRVIGCDVAMMHARHHNQPWEVGAGGPAGAGLALATRGRRD